MWKSDLLFLFVPVLLSEASIEFLWPLPSRVEASVHGNVTLSCVAVGEGPLHTFWTKDGQPIFDRLTWTLAHRGELHLARVGREDAGQYTCVVQNTHDKKTRSTNLLIMYPPDRLANVSVHPSTVLATVSWQPAGNGGVPIANFTLRYRQVNLDKENTWRKPLPNHLGPATHQVDLFHLKPNSTYEMQIWASNRIGPGEAVSLQFSTLKPPGQLELARHMLAGGDEYTVTAWLLAVSLVLGTIVALCIASCWLIYKDWKRSLLNESPYYENEDSEELMRNIVMPPAYEQLGENNMVLMQQADENFNSQQSFRFYNNNSVVHPCRV